MVPSPTVKPLFPIVMVLASVSLSLAESKNPLEQSEPLHGNGVKAQTEWSVDDGSPVGKYLRQLQDTLAKYWYMELRDRHFLFEFSRGTLQAHLTVSASGQVKDARLESNTGNPALGSATLQSFFRAPLPRFPAAISASSLALTLTFRVGEHDPTDGGLTSSYPEILLRRSVEVGTPPPYLSAYRDLSVFLFQARILQATPIG